MAVAKTTKIQATSRCSIKIRDTFYTVEYAEERAIPEGLDVNLEEERRELWDCVNGEVDKQIDDIYNMYNKK